MVEDLNEEEKKLYFKMIGQDQDEEQLYVSFDKLGDYLEQIKETASK